MKRLKTLWNGIIFLILIFVCSCSEDQPNSIEEVPEDVITELENSEIDGVIEDLEKLLDSSESNTLETFINEAKKIKYVKSCVLSDSIVLVSLANEMQVKLDFAWHPREESILEESDLDDYPIDQEKLWDSYFLDFDVNSNVEEANDLVADLTTQSSLEVSYSRTNSSNERYLIKSKIALWNPLEHIQSRVFGRDSIYVKNAASQVKWQYEHLSPSLKSINLFGKYDIVVVSCHGSKEGTLILPLEYLSRYEPKLWDNQNKRPNYKALQKEGIILYLKKNDKANSGTQPITGDIELDGNYFKNNLLPGVVKNTIIWTDVCHVGKRTSATASAFWDSTRGNCAELFGADDGCGSYPLRTLLPSFLKRLCSGKSATKAFNDGKDMIFVSKQNLLDSYNYVRYSSYSGYPRPTYYLDTRPKQPKVQMFKAWMRLTVLSPFIKCFSRALGDSSVELGYLIRNNSTGKTFEYIVDEYNSVILEERETSEMMSVTLIENEFPFLENEEGEYEYCTFLRHEGITSYSKTKQSIRFSKTIEIRTAQEFYEFRERFFSGETYEGYTIELMNDIDLGPDPFLACDTNFKGVFNGNGHTLLVQCRNFTVFLFPDSNYGIVKDLNIKYDSISSNGVDYFLGMFRNSNCGEILNCSITAEVKNYLYEFYGFCEDNYGIISHSRIEGDIMTSGGPGFGFVTVNNYNKISNCVSAVNITTQNLNYSHMKGVGCIVENNYPQGVIENCVNQGDFLCCPPYELYVNGHITGIAFCNEGLIKDCSNYGNIPDGCGICSINKNTIESCYNYGKALFGIAMWNWDYTGVVKNCTNHGNLSQQFNTYFISAGIVSDNSNIIENCVNYGEIEHGVGIVEGNSERGTIKNCTNYGKVNYGSGICISNDGVIENSDNYGIIYPIEAFDAYHYGRPECVFYGVGASICPHNTGVIRNSNNYGQMIYTHSVKDTEAFFFTGVRNYLNDQDVLGVASCKNNTSIGGNLPQYWWVMDVLDNNKIYEMLKDLK